MLVGLNKGETLHSMAREVSFGHQGRFTDRAYEAQLNRASALSLVINAIVVWNTRHFERARAKLLEEGVTVEDSVWQHLSPLVWKHINFVGSYHFFDIHLEEEFRPLRESEGRRARRESRTASLAESSTEETAPLSLRAYEEELPVQLSLLQEYED